MNAAASIGHNMPPEPIEAMRIHVDALVETAQGFLDGDPITDQQTADVVSQLITEARKARKDADALRAEEKKPHDEAAKAVQAKWKPLLDRCDLVNDTAKKALTPYLAALEAKRIEEERIARVDALRKAQEAAEAMRAAGTDIAAREQAEQVAADAKDAERHAARLGKQKAHAKGDGRAIGLRSVWTPTLTDPMAALKHYMAHQPGPLKDWLLDQAAKDVAGGARTIPGFEITEDRRAQ